MKIRWKKDTILEVTFLDIQQDAGWREEDTAMKRPPDSDIVCRCVGHYLKTDKDLLYLSMMLSGKKRDQTVIPIGCIKRVRVLKGK